MNGWQHLRNLKKNITKQNRNKLESLLKYELFFHKNKRIIEFIKFILVSS